MIAALAVISVCSVGQSPLHLYIELTLVVGCWDPSNLLATAGVPRKMNDLTTRVTPWLIDVSAFGLVGLGVGLPGVSLSWVGRNTGRNTG